MHKDIFFHGKLIAQFYDLNSVKDISFPTPDESSLQFGYGTINHDKSLLPHIHKEVERIIQNTAEFLYVINGKMKIEILYDKENIVEVIELKNNQGLLQFHGGHRINISEGTKYFEIKQGPYLGKNLDKEIIK